jgi:protein-S-isoprenylcysteine O-methyltransferase Ste14
MFCVQTAGSVFGLFAFEHLDTGEFLGYKQVRRYLARGEVGGNIEGLTPQELVMTGVYGIVRHPLYLAGIIIFTFNPRITVNGLTVTVLADAYFLFGVFMEERRLVGLFGEQYREYRRRVPLMIPRFMR